MRTVVSFILVAIASLAIPVFAHSQESTAPEITRADLAAAYILFDRAYSRADISDQRRAEIGVAFDQSTQAFFRQDYQEALRTINALAIALSGLPEGFEALYAWRVRVSSYVHLIGEEPPTLTIVKLYETRSTLDKLCVMLEETPEQATLTPCFELPDSGMPLTGVLTQITTRQPGRYNIGLGAKGGVPSAAVSVVAESLETVCDRNAKRLDAIEAAGADTADIAAVRARNQQLLDSPSVERHAVSLFNAVELQEEIDREITTLERGGNPFDGRRGDYWRTINTDDADVAMRIYCPPNASAAGELPLLIAFHGAGTDENAFMDAYGMGALKTLADKHQFVAVSPNAYAFRGDSLAGLFEAIVDEMATDYEIDRDRIYIIGHSMGGMVVTQLAKAFSDSIAGACGLAGFSGFDGAETVPPTLVVASPLDPIVPASRIKPLAESARDRGLPVTYKEFAHQGHTTIVNDALGYAIAWLLER